MEKACVSTYVSGIPELITDGENGLLVPEKDASALADALERLMADRALAERLGRASRVTIQQGNEAADSVARLGRMFRAILGGEDPLPAIGRRGDPPATERKSRT